MNSVQQSSIFTNYLQQQVIQYSCMCIADPIRRSCGYLRLVWSTIHHVWLATCKQLCWYITRKCNTLKGKPVESQPYFLFASGRGMADNFVSCCLVVVLTYYVYYYNWYQKLKRKYHHGKEICLSKFCTHVVHVSLIRKWWVCKRLRDQCHHVGFSSKSDCYIKHQMGEKNSCSWVFCARAIGST